MSVFAWSSLFSLKADEEMIFFKPYRHLHFFFGMNRLLSEMGMEGHILSPLCFIQELSSFQAFLQKSFDCISFQSPRGVLWF